MLCKTRTKNSEVDSKEETALDWLQRLDYEGAHLKIGNSHFDRLKIRTGELIEIVGGDATGKMQLGMTLIAEQLLSDRECKCLVNVIDFNGSFRIDRLTEILSSRRHHYDGFSGCDFLDRVKYSLAKISTELESRLHELKILLKYSSSNSIIFINKIGSILFNAVAKENIEGNTQMRILKELEGICQDFGTTIITTNHIVDWRGYQAPALGKIWIKGIETRIFLSVDQTGYFAQMTTDGKLPTEAEKIPYSLSQKGFDVPIHPYPI